MSWASCALLGTWQILTRPAGVSGPVSDDAADSHACGSLHTVARLPALGNCIRQHPTTRHHLADGVKVVPPHRRVCLLAGDGSLQPVLELQQDALSVQWLSGYALLAACGNVVHVWDGEAGHCCFEGEGITCVAAAPDTPLLAVGTAEPKVCAPGWSAHWHAKQGLVCAKMLLGCQSSTSARVFKSKARSLQLQVVDRACAVRTHQRMMHQHHPGDRVHWQQALAASVLELEKFVNAGAFCGPA